MKAGIIGHPKTGKSTLFKLLTKQESRKSARQAVAKPGIMEVPDERVSWLSDLLKPQRTVYEAIEVFDVQPCKGQEFLNSIRNFDVLIYVVGVFTNEPGCVDALEQTETEMLISDLELVERRIQRITSHKSKPASPMELPFLDKCKEALGKGLPIRSLAIESHEQKFLFNYSFLTAKPVVLAINAREESLSQSFKNFNAGKYVQVVFSGIIEEEIMSLPEPDQIAFLESYGLKESGVSRIGKEVYACLNLLTFFTVENNEVRAWSIPKGFTAKEAAGKIHTDMERGFIRAEVVSYRDLHRLGSLKACKDKGVLRLEGKDYQVKDGDILNIRFNV